MALDLTDRHSPGVERDDFVVEAIQARLAFGHDLRLEAAVAVARHLDLDRPILGQHRLGVGPVAVVAGPSAGGIALLITKMVRQLGAQRPLEQRLLQLLEQAFLAQQVLRLLVAGQKLVKMFWLDRHRVVPFVRLPTDCPHTIFLTLPGLARCLSGAIGGPLGAPGGVRLSGGLLHSLRPSPRNLRLADP